MLKHIDEFKRLGLSVVDNGLGLEHIVDSFLHLVDLNFELDCLHFFNAVCVIRNIDSLEMVVDKIR